MRIATQVAALVALLISIAWVIYKPGLDSSAAVATAVVALLSSFFLKKANAEPKQVQKISGRSVGIQAGRDAKVDNFNLK